MSDHRDKIDHLAGIVALWLTNGHEPVDGGNDTRYFAFKGGWMDAADATRELLNEGYIDNAQGDGQAEGDPWDPDFFSEDLNVWPTAKGLWEVLRT